MLVAPIVAVIVIPLLASLVFLSIFFLFDQIETFVVYAKHYTDSRDGFRSACITEMKSSGLKAVGILAFLSIAVPILIFIEY